MEVSPFIRQFFIVGACLLASLSAGCAQGYPMVLLLQLSQDNSTIKLNLDAASWLGSIHGVAGIISIFMTMIMQWRGRIFAFRLGCITALIGWVIVFCAESVTSLLISEVFHGCALTSIATINILTISEMSSPEYRNLIAQSSCIVHGLGVASAGILSRFLYWKTICVILAVPAIIALFMSVFWLESPPWLACKGRFEECEDAFTQLRSMTNSDRKELQELIAAQKKGLAADRNKAQWSPTLLYYQLRTRELYTPLLHMSLLLNLAYWTGAALFVIDNLEIMQKTTIDDKAIFIGGIMVNVAQFLGLVASNVLSRWMNNKNIVLCCTALGMMCLIGLIVATVSQDVGWMSKNTSLCVIFHVMFVALSSPGLLSVVFTICSELLPVKYRGLGGALYVISNSILCSSSLKIPPYLFLYIRLWGTFLVFLVNASICGYLIWKYVPETKYKTLQQIEDFYTFGKFVDTRLKHNEDKAFVAN